MKVNKTEAMVKFLFPKFFKVHQEYIKTMEIRGAEIAKLRNDIINYEKVYDIIQHYNELNANKVKNTYSLEINKKITM